MQVDSVVSTPMTRSYYQNSPWHVLYIFVNMNSLVTSCSYAYRHIIYPFLYEKQLKTTPSIIFH